MSECNCRLSDPCFGRAGCKFEKQNRKSEIGMNISQDYKDRFIGRLTQHYGMAHETAVEEFYATTEQDGFIASTPELDADEAISYYDN